MPQRLFALLILTLGLSACGGEETPDGEAPLPTIPFEREGTLTFLGSGDPGPTIAIEIAETDSARRRGLMQRMSLPEKSGMLFIFEREEPQSFWMANTPLALDLFFVDADSQIVSLSKYAEPYSPDPIPSGAPAKYVVEVPAGFADTYGITIGDHVRWQREETVRVDAQASDRLPS